MRVRAKSGRGPAARNPHPAICRGTGASSSLQCLSEAARKSARSGAKVSANAGSARKLRPPPPDPPLKNKGRAGEAGGRSSIPAIKAPVARPGSDIRCGGVRRPCIGIRVSPKSIVSRRARRCLRRRQPGSPDPPLKSRKIKFPPAVGPWGGRRPQIHKIQYAPRTTARSSPPGEVARLFRLYAGYVRGVRTERAS